MGISSYSNKERSSWNYHCNILGNRVSVCDGYKSWQVESLLIRREYWRPLIDGRSSGIHQWVVVPLLRRFYPDAEDAHEVGNKSLKLLYQFGLHPRERDDPDKAGDLQVKVGTYSFKIWTNG